MLFCKHGHDPKTCSVVMPCGHLCCEFDTFLQKCIAPTATWNNGLLVVGQGAVCGAKAVVDK